MNLNNLIDLPGSSSSCRVFVFLVRWDDLGTTGRDVRFGFSGSEKKRKKKMTGWNEILKNCSIRLMFSDYYYDICLWSSKLELSTWHDYIVKEATDSHQACKLAKTLTGWWTSTSTVPTPWTELSQTLQGVLVSSRGHLVKGDGVHFKHTDRLKALTGRV